MPEGAERRPQGLGATEAGVVGIRGRAQARVKAGAASGAGRGGRTREAGKGCDERRAVHCGNPGAAASGSSSLVPAEPGGGRERGTRGREARRRGRPGRSAERTGASGRPGSGPSPCSRPVSAARAWEPQAAGPHRPGPARALLPPRAGRRPAPGNLGRLPSGLGLLGVRQGPSRVARGSGWFCSESKPGNQLLSETHPCPGRGALWGRG